VGHRARTAREIHVSDLSNNDIVLEMRNGYCPSSDDSRPLSVFVEDIMDRNRDALQSLAVVITAS
jgi:hypothetical protein